MKQCSKCKETKEFSEFPKDRSKTTGYASHCKPCKNAKNKEYRSKPGFREKNIEYQKQYREENREQLKEKYLAKAQRPEEKIRKRNYMREFQRRRRREDPAYKMQCSVSRMVHHALAGNHKSNRTFDALPYTPQQLKEHLESQFEDWMSWDNYGEWEVDHIYPQSLLPYDSLDHPNFLKCWALKNLQPLGKIENIKKSNKILDHFQ